MTDLDVIKQIEKEINVKLKQLDDIEIDKAGYIINKENEVTGLSLPHCKIEDISLLKELKGLTELYLRNNQISNISSLKELKNLTKLHLDANQIKDISPLKKLKNLIELNLSNNLINNVSPLKEIENLKTLFLIGNQINDISTTQELKNLTNLYLAYNQISDIHPLKELKNLTRLSLGDNQINDISPLKELKGLTELSLNGNQVSDIFHIKGLENLTELDLSENKIVDISPLKELKSLTELFLGDNQISDISSLKELMNLKLLFLDKNEISDISSFKELRGLLAVSLRNNSISELPSWITDFNINLYWIEAPYIKGINFFTNPLTTPPPEIVKQGKEAVRNYFKQLKEQGKDNIYEAKLMIVGEPGSGKTSLMNKLFDEKLLIPDKNQKATVGIEVRQNWSFKVNEKNEFKAHIWDFGGQQIQYMLHQFFLTSGCVYILMAEKRKELANFDYWLNIINILGKNSPVIILFNEINIDAVASFIYDEKKYKELFPGLNLQKLDINLSKTEDRRFEVLVNTIKENLQTLGHIGKEVPAKWVDIRRGLEEVKNKRHISIEEYFDICSHYGINIEQDRMLILRYFHLIGIVLHFSEDPNLSDTLFLDPNWAVDAVYSVLSNKEVENNGGLFDKDELMKIWDKKNYSYNERTKLLQLMLKDNFELCYKLREDKEKYIVPLLLPGKKPDYSWEDKNNLQFRFQYPFIPKGIVNRLIVRMHEYIENRIEWGEGVVFIKDGVRAQVVEKITIKEGLKFIEIRLTGHPNKRKDFLAIIREEIKKIQDGSFPSLPYSEMVPCNCSECRQNAEMEFYGYDTLEKAILKNRTEIQCRRSFEMVKINELIDAVGIKIVEKVLYDDESSDKKIERIEKLTNQKTIITEEIEALEKQKVLCKETAKKKIEKKKIIIVAIQIAVFIILSYFIMKLDWDKTERYTFFAEAFLFSVQSLIAIIFYRKSYIGDALKEKLEQEIKKQYIKTGYSEFKHNRLKSELQQIEAELFKILNKY